MTYPHRIIVAIDVDAVSSKEAYRAVRRWMNAAKADWEWESTGEWYDHEGNQLTRDETETLRALVWAEEQGK